MFDVNVKKTRNKSITILIEISYICKKQRVAKQPFS